MAQPTTSSSSTGTSNREVAQRNSSAASTSLLEDVQNIDVKAAVKEISERGREYMAETERYVQAHPMRVAFGAAGIGLLIGFLLRGSGRRS